MFPSKSSWSWVTSQWQKKKDAVNIPHLLYKVAMFLLAFGLMFHQLTNPEQYLLKDECYIVWHILWTNLAAQIFTLVQFLQSLILLSKTCQRNKVPSSGLVYYVLQLASLVFSTTSTLLFWSLCHNLLHASRKWMYTLKCGCGFVLTHLDLMLGASNVKLSHVWISIVFAVLFTSWAIAAKYRQHMKQCTSIDGAVGILPFEQLGENKAALIYEAIFIAAMIAAHIFEWGLSRLKMMIYHKYTQKHSRDFM